MTNSYQLRQHLNATLPTSICIFRSVDEAYMLQKGFHFKGIARHPFHCTMAPSRGPAISSWEPGLYKDIQLSTVNAKATPSCFPACNPFARHLIHQAGRVKNETCRCCRQHCCGKLQPHSKASSKQKTVTSLPRGPWLAILLTQQPDGWVPVHPAGEAASTSPQQNWANTGMLPLTVPAGSRHTPFLSGMCLCRA